MIVPWEIGHVEVPVLRATIFDDSFKRFQEVKSCDNMRKMFRFNFLEESGLDAGGLAREWFELISESFFDASRGLFVYNKNGFYEINEYSYLDNEDDIEEFYFFGKFMGKAVFDGQVSALIGTDALQL